MKDKSKDITVNCYSGHTYAQEPRSFLWEGVEYRVAEIVKMWREPGERHFLVKTGGNKSFQICYNEANTRWSLNEV
jgi:hypothetical protein